MPSIIASTTPGAIEDALRAVIVAIVPTEASHRDAGWTPMEDNRTESSSSQVPRLFQTEILAASIRTVNHVTESARIGADVITAPPAVIKKLAEHPLTDKGIEGFMADWEKTGQKIL